MKKIEKYAAIIVCLLSALFAFGNAESFEKAELYGAWANAGADNLGNAGILFITPNYAAYLEKTKGGGCAFRKYAYEISADGKQLDIPGFCWFRIENKSGAIILNRTKWIIPHALSCDGIVRREKMCEQELRQYLENCGLDADAMKKAPIKNLKSNPLPKEEWERIAELAKTDFLAAQKEIKTKTINEEIADDSLPAEIEKYILERGK